jgi:cytidylate kinase
MSHDVLSDSAADQAPLHGYGGERTKNHALLPMAPSLAITRDVGARGGEVARRLGQQLGWQVFDRETLEYNLNDAENVNSLMAELPADAADWIERRLQFLNQNGLLATDPTLERVARLVLAIGARGEAIFVGRGAGFILPRDTTLHIRMTAPLADRITYMTQFLRMTREEAAAQVSKRSVQRDAFLKKCFNLPSDGVVYDMILNSSSLGEDICAQVAITALECKRLRRPYDSGEIVV